MDENLNAETLEKEVEQRTDKNSSRTFTQSEVDQMVFKASQKAKSQFEDYETIKKEYETLKAAQREKELSEKSELEKLQSINSELTTELTNVKNQVSTYEKERLRMDVLNGNKYLRLPRAYKNMVKLSGDKDEIIASAEEVLAEFEKDTGKKIADTFGVPETKDTAISEPGKKVETPADLAASLRSRVHSLIKGANRS